MQRLLLSPWACYCCAVNRAAASLLRPKFYLSGSEDLFERVFTCIYRMDVPRAVLCPPVVQSSL